MARGYEVPTKPKWEPVVVPNPRFSGPVEAKAYLEAVNSTERLAGEGICEWLERVNLRAREVPPPILLEREPGSDDE